MSAASKSRPPRRACLMVLATCLAAPSRSPACVSPHLCPLSVNVCDCQICMLTLYKSCCKGHIQAICANTLANCSAREARGWRQGCCYERGHRFSQPPRRQLASHVAYPIPAPAASSSQVVPLLIHLCLCAVTMAEDKRLAHCPINLLCMAAIFRRPCIALWPEWKCQLRCQPGLGREAKRAGIQPLLRS